MKTRIIFISVFALIMLQSFDLNNSVRKVLKMADNNAFAKGEKIKYRLYYTSALTGKVDAAELTSEVLNKNLFVKTDPVYGIKVVGKTKGAFEWFFKVNDLYETYIDTRFLVPRYFRKSIKEGDYKMDGNVYFYHEEGKAIYNDLTHKKTGTVSIAENVQDLISVIYNTRNINTDTLEVGDKLIIPFFLDDAVYTSTLKYLGKVVIKTSLGKVECLKFQPGVLTGGVFKDEDKLFVYVSNDKNHLPILAQSEVMVGAIKAELIEYSGLKNPFTSLKN